MNAEQYIYMLHHFMSSEIHENVSKYPENLYSIESLDQELFNAVPDESGVQLQRPGGALDHA